MDGADGRSICQRPSVILISFLLSDYLPSFVFLHFSLVPHQLIIVFSPYIFVFPLSSCRTLFREICIFSPLEIHLRIRSLLSWSLLKYNPVRYDLKDFTR